MKKSTYAAVFVAAAAIGAFMGWNHASADELKLTTGAVGGTYHDVIGVNLRNVLRERGTTAELMESTGSGENLNRLARDEADVAFSQADAFARWMRNNPTGDAEIIGSIGQECLFMVTRADSNIDRISRLNSSEHRVAVGAQGSGSALSWDYVRMLNDAYAAPQTFYQGGIRAISQVRTGQLDAFMWVTSPENRSHRFFEAVLENDDLQFVNFNDRQLRGSLPNGDQVYTEGEILIQKRRLLPDVTADTICTDLLVLARRDLSDSALEELAYNIMMNASRIKGN